MKATHTFGRPAPIQLLTRVTQALEEEGISKQTLLKGSTLLPEMLENGDSWVSFKITKDIISKALRLSKSRSLGIATGKLQTPSGLGLMGYAANCCATLGDVLKLAVKYQRITSNINYMSLEENKDELHWIVTHPWSMDDILPFAVEECFTVVNRLSTMLTGQEICIRDAWFTFDGNNKMEEYQNEFGQSLKFNQSSNRLIIDAACANYPVLQSSTLGYSIATRLCDELMTAHPVEDDIVIDVRRLLISRPGVFPDEQAIAGMLHIAPRTLRHKLMIAGHNYQSILNNVREQLSREYLQHTPLKIDDIANRLGYSDCRCFRRAFRQWTDMSPSEFRRSRSAT